MNFYYRYYNLCIVTLQFNSTKYYVTVFIMLNGNMNYLNCCFFNRFWRQDYIGYS